MSGATSILGPYANTGTTPVPTGNPMDQYTTKLLADATAQYPYLKKHNLKVTVGKGEGYAETWHPGDPGDANYPRDPRIPLNQAGVTVYKPDQFGPSDLAAEGLHLDPVSKMIRQRMLASLTPEQAANLQKSGDYRMSVDRGMTPDQAMSNGVDAALRGQVFGQWPDDANKRMKYTPEQQGLLNTLKRYVTTGNQ